MTVSTMTRERENRKMLAAILGINEDEATRRLEATILITSASDEASQRIAGQIEAMLDRTVTASSEPGIAERSVVEVIVGPAKPRTSSVARVWVGSVAEGILVSKDMFSQIPGSEHPIFGLLAACYACGMALRFALGRQLPFGGNDLILVSPNELLGEDLALIDLPCHLGEAVLAGAGAVGNGFLYGLQLFRAIGRLHVVDPKHVHDGVLNRCIWFIEEDINEAKAVAIKKRAQRVFTSLELVPHVMTVKELCVPDYAPPLSRLITAVDSRRVRRSLQNEIPKEVFDASTTGIAEVVLHFNEQPSDRACLSCIYRQDSGEIQHEAHVAEVLGVSVEDVKEGLISSRAARLLCTTFPDLKPEDVMGKAYDTIFKARCAEGKLLTAADQQVLAPFCFVSILAGAYLSMEFVRRVNAGRISEPFNYWRLSTWHSPIPGLRALRPSRTDCEYCTESVMRDVAISLWTESRPVTQ
jgi:molybdopterin/thiamine biosynthesis adenylyltransferase